MAWKKKTSGGTITDTSVNLTTKLSSLGVKAYDSFNRADSVSSLGVADTGQTWQALAGTWGIQGNIAKVTTSSGIRDYAILDSGFADGTVKATIVINAVDARIAVRVTDALNNIYLARISTGYRLVRYQAGVASALGENSTIAPANNDVLKITMSGSLITVFLNGTQILSVTETFNQTATRHGLSGFAVTTYTYDEFEVTQP